MDAKSDNWIRIASLLMSANIMAGCEQSPVDMRPQPVVQSSAVPRIQIVDPRRSLGEIPVGERGVSFEIVNRGEGDLKIVRLEQSCGCTKLDLSAEEIAPGGRAILDVVIHPTKPEERSATISVFSNDPDRSHLKIELDWQAKAQVEVEPAFLTFDAVRVGEPVTRPLVLTFNRALTPTIHCTLDNIECRPMNIVHASRTEQRKTDGREIETWEIQLTPDQYSTKGSGHVVLDFTDCGMERMFIPLRWELRAPVEASPAQLFVGSGTPGTPWSGEITISCDSDAELQLESVTWDHPALEYAIRIQRVSATQTLIDVSGTFPDTEGIHRYGMNVIASQPAGHTLSIPVSVLVLGKPQ